jgi:predicted acyltransferase
MTTAPVSAKAPRLVSLDAFRGATIAAMLLVNNPGSWDAVYAPLDHAPWNGWTPTDMIFPFFLWIVGVSLTFSFARRVEEGADRGELFRHVVQRSAIIFGLGLFLAAFPFGLLPEHHFSLAKLRIPGVLQRIAVCYLAAGAIFLRTGVRGQVAWVGGLLAGYALMLKFVPVPGYGAGVLEPTGNLAWWIDSHLLAGHTWSGAPAPGFDPEGILSTLPAIATTLCGVLAGHLLRTPLSGAAKTGRLLAGGAVLLLAGALLDLWLPINKNLWTSSYVLFMAGWAMVIFAAMFWLIDVRGWRRWATPFVIYGMNALALFVLSGVIGRLFNYIKWTNAQGAGVTLKAFLHQSYFAPLASPRNASLLFAVAFVGSHLLVAWFMWRRRWFVRV